MGLVDVSRAVRFHVSVSDRECAVVMTQGEGPDYVVVALMGRDFSVTEQSWPEAERLLAAASWGVRRLAKYTMYLPAIEIALPNAGLVACVKLHDVHAKLQAWILELQSYGCSFVDGQGAWEL